MYTTFSDENDKQIQEEQQKQKKAMSLLSYYQSTLRNAGMFTTLSLATLAAAHSYTVKRNPWGAYARYALTLLFLSLAIYVSFRLVQLREKHKESDDPLKNWKYFAIVLLVAQSIILIAIVLSFIKRMIRKL